MMELLGPNFNPGIDHLQEELLLSKGITLDLLRLDQIHPAISGNKWFKLRCNIQEAQQQGKELLISFGGAYSNHLHALAFAGYQCGMKTLGLVRGEAVNNPTLTDCIQWGMQIQFVPREDYRRKNDSDYLSYLQDRYPNSFIIPEGGNNTLGQKGCEEIVSFFDPQNYDFIACSVGSGATLSGLIQGLQGQSTVLGYVALKGGGYLWEEINKQVSFQNFQLILDAHEGGFAKTTAELIQFQNAFFNRYHITLDFVYTAKMMMDLYNKIQANYFPIGSKILAIHTGGVQGNRSMNL